MSVLLLNRSLLLLNRSLLTHIYLPRKLAEAFLVQSHFLVEQVRDGID